MAKRSNTIRNKKFQTSKPYDVSNSFVKKVASRVSELLPQSIWPTNWFSSPNNEIHHQGNGREALNAPLAEDEETSPIPAKRARIPLNSPFNEPAFSASTTASDFETHRLRRTLPTVNVIEDGFDEPVAGPSGLQRQFVAAGSAESSIPKSRESLIYSTKKVEINGEDHSDSSESTSGCSSLPQGDHNAEVRNVSQTQSKELQVDTPEPSIQVSLKRRYSEAANCSSMATQNSRLFPGLGGYSPPNRATPVPVGRRRKPSFNPDAFGLHNWGGEKSSIRDKIVNSPFYSGRTTYGGVAAYQSSLNKSENQSIQGGRRSIQIRPKNVSQVKESSTSMSSTARRIMEALEMFSSPIQDAKKIPLNDSIHIKRRKVLASQDFSQSSLHSSRSSNLTMQDSMTCHPGEVAPPVKELMVPTVPDILAMRRRQRLQGSTVAARQAVSETITLPPNAEKGSGSDQVPVSFIDNRSSGRAGGKIKSKEEINDEPVEEPNLPNIALPITSLPKFDFILPPLCPPQQILKQVDSKPSSKQVSSMSFKFSSPIAFSGASEMPVSTNNFTFSSPLKAPSKDTFDASTPKVNLSIPTVSFNSVSSVENDKHSQCAKKSTSSKENNSQLGGTWLNKSSDHRVSDDGGRGSESVDQGNLLLSAGICLSGKDSFGGKFKPAVGSWECETCMVCNNADVTKCVACETQRSCKVGTVSNTKTVPAVCSGFGDSFKPPSGSWTCDTCLVTNPSTSSKCQACETSRSKEVKGAFTGESSKIQSKVVESGFGDKFKKPEGDWDCNICLVRNKAGGPQKCVACEAPKPGAEPVKTAPSQIGPKFSFGSPVTSGFTFGISQADLSKKDGALDTPKPSFTFGNPSSTPATGFTFDFPDAAKKAAVPQSTPKFIFGAKDNSESVNKSPSIEPTNVKFGNETKDDAVKTTTLKAPVEPENKSISGKTSSPASTGFGIAAASSKPAVVNDPKPTFSFASSEESKKEPTSNNSIFSFDGNSAVIKPTDEENKPLSIAFNSPSSTSNTHSVFGSTTAGSAWTSGPSFKLDSSPKSSIFAKNTTAVASANNVGTKVEENANPGALAFKFGDTAKAEASTKLTEVPGTLSSNFKVQEPSKTTTSIFKFEEKPKATSSATSTLSTTTFASSPFSSGGFGATGKENMPVSSTTPVSTAASSTSVTTESSATKTTNAGLFMFSKGSSPGAVSSTSIATDSPATKVSSPGLFMFGSGSSSQPTAFNVPDQKQPAPTTTATTTAEQSSQPLGSNVGSTTSMFGSVIPKTSVFGTQSSASSPSSTAPLLPVTKSEPLSSVSTTFASPTASSIFGSSVSSSVTTSVTVATTTTVSSSSSTFGSSIFGTASTSFSAVGSAAPAPAFGSTTTAPLAAPSVFGAPQPQSSSVFGISSSTSATPFTFTASAKTTTEEQQRLPATNPPFVFGGGGATATQPAAQPFTFNATPSKPAFSFGSSAVSSQGVVAGGGQSSATTAAPVLGGFSFGDASKGTTPFGSSQPATSIAGGTVNPFGSPPAATVTNITPAVPAFGTPLAEGNAASSGTFGSTPAFNFGNSQSTPVFSFNSNQVNVAQTPAFNFGQTPQQNTASQITFNPNVTPSFNFTGGATPQFTATPGVLNSVPGANPMPRRIKKAVRRSQQPR